jgi:aminopeptidase N
MFPDNLTRAEAQLRSDLLSTNTYRVEVDLTGRRDIDPETTFVSTSEVSFSTRRRGRTHIDLIGERVLAASLDQVALDTEAFASSRFPLVVEPGDHQLTITAVYRFSRTGEGLHRFVDPSDSRIYLYSQFEVSDARRVFACFEQPDLKARFQIAVLAPKSWTVVSNGSQTDRTELDQDYARWDFAETEPISTYLTAVVAGDYYSINDSYAGAGGWVPMTLMCRQSLVPDFDTDRILTTTKSGFEVFERDFGVAYPFGKYDQVFVPEYNGGAMENVGCVTLRDDYLFRSKVTSASYEGRDNTILHELSHMWFGDLVTMKWWDDLWLKESFAEWASHYSMSQSGDDPDHPWAAFCNSRKNWAYRQDQLPSTHPIAADMVDLEAVELNFDGITYAKGASVLRQLVAFVGLGDFLSGVRAYFHEHAFGNTQLRDLLTALQKSSGRDLTRWSDEWLEKAGVNTLKPVVEAAGDGTFASLEIEQTAPTDWPTLRSHRIAIGLYDLSDGELRRRSRIETDVTGARTAILELVGEQQPDLTLVNDDDLTYAKVRLDSRSLRTVLDHIHQLRSPLARAVCWGATWDMCRDAELPAADYVELALRGVGDESDLTAVGAVLAQGLKAAVDFTDIGERDAVRARWEEGLLDLLTASQPGSDHQLALAKAYPAAVRSASGSTRLSEWLAGTDVPDGLAIDTQLRWTVVTNLARLGAIAEAAIDAELRSDPTIMGAEHAAGARAAQPSEHAKAAAWRLAVDEDSIPNETHKRICLQFWQPDQEAVLAPYLDRYLQVAEDISDSRDGWATKGVALRKNVLVSLFPQPADTTAFIQQLDGWLDRTELADSVRRLVDERRHDTLRALRCREASAAASRER